MPTLLQDVRYAIRVLAKNPGFTLIALVTLALGIGANSAMFSLVDAVLFRPLPVSEPEQLVRIGMTDDKLSGLGGLSYPLLKDLQQQARALSGIAAYSAGNAVNLTIGDQQAERAMATTVTGNFFSVLGVRPQLGKLIGPEDDVSAGGHPVLVLSDTYWRRRFAANPNVIGSSLRMNTENFIIIGVAPRGFQGATLEEPADVWIPVAMITQVNPNLAQFKPLEGRGFSWLDAVGRLQPGATVVSAGAQLNVINARIMQELKIDVKEERYARVHAMPLAAASLSMESRVSVLQTSEILLGVTGLVLLIACAVAAGLLLVRAEERQREVAVRFAIGASRGRIVRQLLTESFLLASAAAVLGVFLALWGKDFVVLLAPESFPLPTGAATPILDPRVLWFTAALALFCTIAFGLLPAWRASKANLSEAIKSEGFSAPGRTRWFSLRNSFVVTQVALSAVLLVAAGLLLRTLGESQRVQLGFNARNGVMISVDVSKSGFNRERGRQFFAQLLDQVRQIPGVKSAAISRHVPVQSAGLRTSLELTNFKSPEGQRAEVSFSSTSPDFFRTIGIPLERGRDFARSDEQGPSPVIVNRAFAERFWPGLDPLQQRVLNFGDKGAAVIGVVANAKLFSVRETAEPMLYVPDFAFFLPNTNLVVRTEAENPAVLAAIVATARNLDRNVPLYRIRTLEEHVGDALGQERMVAGLLSAFALLALTLAAIGLYGVISYATQTRRREFGIRLALGALPADLLRSVVGRGLRLALVGLAIGLGIAAAASRVMASLLFGVSQTDPLTYFSIALLLMTVALGASFAPARRAACVNPMQTLRHE